MSEEVNPYTPATNDLREVWAGFSEYGGLIIRPSGTSTFLDDRYAEFDRWLATVKAQALNDVADQMYDRFTALWLRGKAREYTHGPHKIVGAFAIPESNQEADCGDQGL